MTNLQFALIQSCRPRNPAVVLHVAAIAGVPGKITFAGQYCNPALPESAQIITPAVAIMTHVSQGGQHQLGHQLRRILTMRIPLPCLFEVCSSYQHTTGCG